MKTYTLRISVFLAVLGAALSASAVCNQTAASQADTDLWNDHGCWQEYFLWQYRAYEMRGSDWTGRGWNDACNRNLEYPKHWNAAYLVTYGMGDVNAWSFHGTEDYRATAEARCANVRETSEGRTVHRSSALLPVTERRDSTCAW